MLNKRALGITLGIVEDELRRLIHLLETGGMEGLFSRIMDDLSPGEKRLISAKIQTLRDSLVFLKNRFALHYSQKNFTLRGILESTTLSLSAQLEDVHSNRLKGYGDVHPELIHHLDPKVDEMIAILRQMASIRHGLSKEKGSER